MIFALPSVLRIRKPELLVTFPKPNSGASFFLLIFGNSDIFLFLISKLVKSKTPSEYSKGVYVTEN
jgi:hypothetical protein